MYSPRPFRPWNRRLLIGQVFKGTDRLFQRGFKSINMLCC